MLSEAGRRSFVVDEDAVKLPTKSEVISLAAKSPELSLNTRLSAALLLEEATLIVVSPAVPSALV